MSDKQKLQKYKQHIAAAHAMVSDLCTGKRKWIMSIPAQMDYDPDLVIGQALRDADRMLDELGAQGDGAVVESILDLCDCGEPFPASGHCGFCGAHARYRGGER